MTRRSRSELPPFVSAGHTDAAAGRIYSRVSMDEKRAAVGAGREDVEGRLSMGREIKRVPVDFDQPMETIWPGYLEEERREPPIGDGWQVWETVSEGSPVTPVFATTAPPTTKEGS